MCACVCVCAYVCVCGVCVRVCVRLRPLNRAGVIRLHRAMKLTKNWLE
jgi:hypothetical protein